MDVVAVGTPACNIAKNFEVYEQYQIYYIDIGLTGKNCFSLPRAKTMEEVEQNTPKFTNLIKNLQNKVMFVCSGGGVSSGSILAILEQMKHLNVDVFYIQPDIVLLNEKARLRSRIVFRVLQEYARSGMLKKLFLIGNKEVSKILGDLSISEYYIKINSLIAESIHMLNFLKNADSTMTNLSKIRDINQIATFGIYNMEEQDEKYFFNIENIREKQFYFAFNEDTLEKEKDLLNKISGYVEKAGQSDLTSVSYDITATTYETDFAYIISHTNFIQE